MREGLPSSQPDDQQSSADDCFTVQTANAEDYLNGLSAEKHSCKVHIPMSYTALAQYLGVDRSAMTRELKSLEEEGILVKEGRDIVFPYRLNL